MCASVLEGILTSILTKSYKTCLTAEDLIRSVLSYTEMLTTFFKLHDKMSSIDL